MKKVYLLSILLSGLFFAACDSEEVDKDKEEELVGIQGEWQSSGSNVAVLLASFFNTDSIYANFKKDFTYVVEQYDTDGAKLTLSGTYTQEESEVDGIWIIEVNQSAPAALISEGIFQITTSGGEETMKYEIVQTNPDISAVPPTPEAGFGSTNGGALGTINIQTYLRIE